MVKCYPCIRGCGLFKGLVGAVLVGLAIWFFSTTPVLLDCNKFQEACVPAFDKLLEDLSAKEAVEETGKEQEFCDCWSSCLNYFQVYEDKQDEAAANNCFLKSKVLIPSSGVNNEQRPQSDGNKEVVGLPSDKCYSCEDIDGYEAHIFNWLGALAMSCGISLWILAACEHMELKWHNACYSLCVVFTDFCVASTLSAGFGIAVFSCIICTAACDPDAMRRAVEDAGRDSTDGQPDHSAAWANFAISLLQPMATELCELKNSFTVYMVCTALGLVTCFFSFFATLCLCCHCSDDGIDETPDDFQANEMKHLMQQGY